MTKSTRTARTLALGATALLVVTGSAVADTFTGAEPASAATSSLTITPNPWYQNTEFEGWGTSLVWFANATGGYPEELREELYQAVFGEDGLDLNIARYNIGGGNASDVPEYLRPGGAVEGWWKADADGSAGTYDGVSTTYAQRDALLAEWDATNPDHYDWDADDTQRWWVQRLADDEQITHWETFANSAPYFMTESGYVSGGFNSTSEQLKSAAIQDFATYLARVTEHLEAENGITVDSIDPLNEPNTNYWGTTLTGGVPVGGRQEGMHVGPARQAELVDALAAVLADGGTTTDAKIAAMDETNPGIFATNWNAYDAETRSNVSRMNVHTYGTSGRPLVRDYSKQADKSLWMSEIEGNWVSGWNPIKIENGLGIASRIHDDLRELEPDAWVLWQPVEDLYNMEPQGENLNWGSILLDLDCVPFVENGETVYKSQRRVDDAGGNHAAVEKCGVVVNSKFNTLRNFTKFITEGDRLIPTNDASTTAAIPADGNGLTVVHSNPTTNDQRITIDLSNFGEIESGATLTPYVTTQAPSLDDPTGNSLVQGSAVPIDANSRSVVVTIPAMSVASFELTGLSGVSADAPALRDGENYQLVGLQSAKALTAKADGATKTVLSAPATTASGAVPQVWTVHEVPAGEREDVRRVVLENGSGVILGATSSGTDLRSISVEDAAASAQTRWIVNTTDGRTFSLVNEALALALDVNGQSSAEGAGVGVYGSNSGSNQAWAPRALTPGTATVSVQTLAGVVPALPATVVPTYAWGQGTSTAVTWTMPPVETWDSTGQVDVAGVAVDIYGNDVTATARVDVGGFTVVDPVSLTTFRGVLKSSLVAAAPTTVAARVGASTQTFPVAVVWDWSGVTDADFVNTGVVTIHGTAQSGDGTDLDATLSVLLTEPTTRNIAPDSTTTASASSTESGYPIDRTRNLVLNDKGWSNWVSGTKPTQSTLSYTFDRVRDVDSVIVNFYRDGTTSWAQTIQFQYLDAASVWQPVPGYETAVAVPIPGGNVAPVVTATFSPVSARGIRVVMNAYPATHLVVSEVQIMALEAAPAAESRLVTLRADGTEIDGFDPDDTEYSLEVSGSAYPVVSAFAIDGSAAVTVAQPSSANGGTATIEVTSADGSQTSTYTVEVVRTVHLADVTIGGSAAVGGLAEAQVVVDPADAELDYQWVLDGNDLDGETGPTLEISAAFVGSSVQVRVEADADGYGDPDVALSDAVTIDPPAGWSSADLADLRVAGATVAGFAPGILDYSVALVGAAFPAVGATASSEFADVDVTQADSDGVARIVVTAGDGTVRTYTVTFARQVGLSAALATAPVAGVQTSVSVTVDPADAILGYEWRLDGVPVAGATSASFTPPRTATGKELSVVVSASAPGFASTTATVGPVAVRAPDGIAPRVTLSVGSVSPGGSVTLTGDGVTPNGEIDIELHSDPVALATVTAAADGTFAATVTIPTGTTPGVHSIVVIDVETGIAAAASLTVAQSADALGLTGVTTAVPVGIAALVLLLAGAAVLIWRRRQRLL